jgi:hypothetical protein
MKKKVHIHPLHPLFPLIVQHSYRAKGVENVVPLSRSSAVLYSPHRADIIPKASSFRIQENEKNEKTRISERSSLILVFSLSPRPKRGAGAGGGVGKLIPGFTPENP